MISKVTTVQQDGVSTRDTSQFIYVRNQRGDSLNVYLVAKGALSEATGYTLQTGGNTAVLRARALNTNSELADSLTMDFNDKDYSIRINRRDLYLLYPEYYKQVRQQIYTDQSVMGVFGLLEDNIGDYPVDLVHPLLLTTRARLDKRLRSASIVTPRSQSDDIKDTWNCVYDYGKDGKLLSVKAASGDDVRFRKQLSYPAGGAIAMKVYRNIEDRQITERKMTLQPASAERVKWQDHIVETGKNRETELSAILYKNPAQPVASMNLAQAELLKLTVRTKNGSRE
ncbi:hypothetical protein [Pedobacter yulinensis]|uniref:hypothetical protein n=1 Tax=Pedobacter yulinensis TaxID=2126353 RepID=UPI0013A6852D|nr:hypothetical protein [Pedobacter yulinensis]